MVQLQQQKVILLQLRQEETSDTSEDSVQTLFLTRLTAVIGECQTVILHMTADIEICETIILARFRVVKEKYQTVISDTFDIEKCQSVIFNT